MWLAATSEQCRKNGGNDGSIRLNRSVGEKQNFAATKAARYELERCRRRQTRRVTLCLTDIVGQCQTRFNEVIACERRSNVARRGTFETRLVHRYGPERRR